MSRTPSKIIVLNALLSFPKREAPAFPPAPLAPALPGLRLRTLAICCRRRSSKRTYSISWQELIVAVPLCGNPFKAGLGAFYYCPTNQARGDSETNVQ